MATSLFEHKRLVTTVAKAKELRPFAEHLITRARNAYNAEKAGTITGTDVHSRRMVGRFIRNKAVLQELFDTIAPLVAERNGGYTRITKLGLRRGDNAPEAMIELVDWSNPQDGRVGSKPAKTAKAAKASKAAKATKTAKAKAPKAAPAAEVAEAPAAEAVTDVAEATSEVVETVDVAAATPAEESAREEGSTETSTEESEESKS